MPQHVNGLQLASVCAVLKAHPGLEFGAPALKRFKRRRANAHSPYVRFKRPRANPHAASVQLSAVDALHADADLPGTVGSSDQVVSRADAERRYQRGTNRRMRRNKPELAACHRMKSARTSSSAPRATTDTWLGKRFVMASRMGNNVPIHAHGKGMRRQSLAQAMLGQAVLHDISHWHTAAVRGPASLIAAFLSKHLHCQPHQTANQTSSSPLHGLDEQDVLECCIAGGYTIDAWLVDSEGQSLGPCIAEVLAASTDQPSAALKPSGPVPLLSAPGSEHRSDCTAAGVPNSQPTVLPAPTPSAPGGPEACVSLTIHPRVAHQASTLLQQAVDVATGVKQLLCALMHA